MNLLPNRMGFLGRRLLPATEYLAENAYVAPGFHRLFTAGGLTLGLWGGRKVMDVVTARHAADGTPMTSEQAPLLLRPLYGAMRYNPYSDTAGDRWKAVADRFAPLMFGALGAWAGSNYFAHGKDWSGKPLHAPSAATLEKMQSGKISLQTVHSAALIKQADRVRIPASGLFNIGSSSGTQILGAFAPFSNGGLSAVNFQLFHERAVNLFNLRGVNRVVFGNRAMGSSMLRPAMVQATRTAEANLMKLGHPDRWFPPFREKLVRNALQNFKHPTAEMEKNLGDAFHAFLTQAHSELQTLKQQGLPEREVADKLHAYLTGDYLKKTGAPLQHFGFLGQSFDNFLHHAGVPLENAEVGSKNVFSFLARMLGSTKAERAIETKWAEHLKATYNIDYGPSKLTLPHWKVATALTGVGAATVGVMLTGEVAAKNLNTRISRTSGGLVDPREPEPQAHGFVHWMNGRPLDFMQWTSRIAITPPSLHRLMSAAFLSGALFGGMKFANVLAGRELKLINTKALPASLIVKESVLAPLRPLHGLLAYTPGSLEITDRWRQAAHSIIPVMFGAVGTATGSRLYFHDRFKKLEQPKTLEDYTDRIMAEQSKAFGALSALTSIFNTGSGLHLLPFVNYSSNLHNRFLMGSGQQVAMPGLGKWWSGNPGLTPWGVKAGLHQIANTLAYNPDSRPRELSSLVHGVLAKLYPDLDYDTLLAKKQVILSRIHEVRDSYLVDDKVPADKTEALHKVMHGLVMGEGFEALLELAGLDPAKANLSSNGVSGTMANLLGRGGKVKSLEQEYRGQFTERIAKREHQAPQSYLSALANGKMESANDNAKAKSHTARLAAEEKRGPAKIA